MSVVLYGGTRITELSLRMFAGMPRRKTRLYPAKPALKRIRIATSLGAVGGGCVPTTPAPPFNVKTTGKREIAVTIRKCVQEISVVEHAMRAEMRALIALGMVPGVTDELKL